jgi:MerR family mercuric resistance operon transcriptional regulator
MNHLTIGHAAKLSGVGVETIRFYERQGLIEQPPKPGSGFRRYSPETVRKNPLHSPGQRDRLFPPGDS